MLSKWKPGACLLGAMSKLAELTIPFFDEYILRDMEDLAASEWPSDSEQPRTIFWQEIAAVLWQNYHAVVGFYSKVTHVEDGITLRHDLRSFKTRGVNHVRVGLFPNNELYHAVTYYQSSGRYYDPDGFIRTTDPFPDPDFVLLIR